MTILHGDDRIYNNIFVQVYKPECDKKPTDPDYLTVGTAPFDIFPSYEDWISQFMIGEEPDMKALAPAHFGHLPVWIGGNAYFNGATVSAHDKHVLSVEEKEVFVRLEKSEGGLCLRSDLWPLLDGFDCGLIGSDTLGCAFEPEQRFENPDGSDLLLDRDFFGNHRGISTVPGPFASTPEEGIVLILR
jgi:hypothetical protein